MHARMGWVAGAAAAAAAALALLVMRAALGGPSLPEVVQDAIVLATPGPLFSFMLDQLRFAGRPLLFAAILVGMFVVGGAIGRAYAARPRSDQAAFRLAALLFVLIGLVGFPLLGAGVLGTGRPADVPLWITTAVAIAVYVGALHLLLRPAWAEPAGLDRGRRRLLGQAAAGASLAGLALIGWRAFALSGGVAPAPTPQPAAAGGAAPATAAGHAATEHPTPDITPIDTFYVVSKNFADPRVAAAGWKVRLDGLVEAPYELTLDELKALPAVEQPATLCCISNEVGGDLVGNAHWKGVRLADLLQKAGVKAGAVDVVFHCRDDYKDSIAIDRATMPGTLVVYEMDGAPLTDKHGFPARVIVPGIFGMKNAKWLQRIEVVDLDFKGFWQQQGWSDPAPYLTMSRIDSPTPGGRVAAGPGVVHGIAFAGDRGISTVEVSTDAGVGWREAKLLPATGPYSWVRWSFEWDAPAGARPTLQVRAYDGGGEPQIARPASPFPDGATGYHSIQIRVAEA